MDKQRLRLGAAYHGSRMPHHARQELLDMATHGMDLVVHMFSHTDWDHHGRVMRDIVHMSEDMGLEVWVDNWGLGGPPSDKSHFLAYYPDSHMYLSNGEIDPVRPCLNSDDFRRFQPDLNIYDFVYDGARTILAWGYYGGESNDYGAENAAVTWHKTCETMQRVRNFECDRILNACRAAKAIKG